MDAWGIVMTAVTMFGMLVLTIAHVTMDSADRTVESNYAALDAEHTAELKKAA